MAVSQGMDAGLLQYRKRANEIVAHLMAKDDERTAVYREYEQGSILLEQVEEYEHQYQVAVQKQEAAFKKVMLAVNDIEKAFSHGNPWLMKFRAISIPEKLERTHLKEWLDHVWINQCIKTWAFDSGFDYANMFSCHVKLLSKGLLRDTSLFSGI